MDTLESKIKQFNLRHPLIQLRFNVHDCYHRPSCFKKGPECRTELPQKDRQVGVIQFEKDNTINLIPYEDNRPKKEITHSLQDISYESMLASMPWQTEMPSLHSNSQSSECNSSELTNSMIGSTISTKSVLNTEKNKSLRFWCQVHS